MKQNILPFKIGKQYEEWEFDLEPLNKDRGLGLDSYLYLKKLLCMGFSPIYIELVFSFDILKIVIFVLDIIAGVKLDKFKAMLEVSIGYKKLPKGNDSVVDIFIVDKGIELWIVKMAINSSVEVAYGSSTDLKKIYGERLK